MFELIGLMFATLFLFLVACVIGCSIAFAAWLIVRNRVCRRAPLVLIAAAIPIFSAAYLWLCIAVLPGESLFGDINQPLPNGYSLQALGKMPDFATINKGDSLSYGSVGLPEYVGSLAASGSFVAGRYSHPFDSFTPRPDEGYFIFDTRTGQLTEFRTLNELELKLGHPIHLVKTQFFRSEESSYKRQPAMNKAIMFAPPATIMIFYILWLLHFKRITTEQPPL